MGIFLVTTGESTTVKRHAVYVNAATAEEAMNAANFSSESAKSEWMRRSQDKTTLKQAMREALWTRQRGRCAWCHTPILANAYANCRRIVAPADGGSFTLDNLELVHPRCRTRLPLPVEPADPRHIALPVIKIIDLGADAVV